MKNHYFLALPFQVYTEHVKTWWKMGTFTISIITPGLNRLDIFKSSSRGQHHKDERLISTHLYCFLWHRLENLYF